MKLFLSLVGLNHNTTIKFEMVVSLYICFSYVNVRIGTSFVDKKIHEINAKLRTDIS